jgi:hypothetical protein
MAMAETVNFSQLREFALRELGAAAYPHDTHYFRLYDCNLCGVVPLALNIEHHTGSKKASFKGVISGECTICGVNKQVFKFTGNQRTPQKVQKPKCSCGSDRFYVANCERYEGEQGMPGFFDEGVIVGQCAECGKLRAFVYTD